VADRRLWVSLRQSGPIPIDVEFTCAPGSVLAIFGPSGSGKTTILRTIAGLYRPAHAVVRSGTETWVDTSSGTFAPAHRRTVGFVFQEYALFPHLTALGNVTAALGHRPRSERRSRGEALLELVHLSSQVGRRPHELSGGERQRVALARALAREPAVLLLDEPFAAVDRSVRRHLQDEIDIVRRTLDAPVILVTHDFDDVIRLATHVLLLEKGRMVAHDAVTSLMSRSDLPWLRDAVGLGAVFGARIARADSNRGLVEIEFAGGTLLAADAGAPVGSTVRVRIPAREIVLATRAPEGLSLHNVVSGTVSAIHQEPGVGHVVVQIAVGQALLLSEVTRDAVGRLGLAVGGQVYALIKSVSIDVDAAPTTNPRR